jgi:hypothetical protein
MIEILERRGRVEPRVSYSCEQEDAGGPALLTTRNSLLDMYQEAQDLPNSHSVASRLLPHLSGSWQTTKCHAHGCTKR